MKSIPALVIMSVAACIAGCAAKPSMVQLAATCPGRSPRQMLADLTKLLTQEGFNIDLVNESVGLVQATRPGAGEIDSEEPYVRYWQMTVRRDTVLATAKKIIKPAKNRPAVDEEVFMDDDAPADYVWYWNVRDGLASMCGTTLHVIARN